MDSRKLVSPKSPEVDTPTTSPSKDSSSHNARHLSLIGLGVSLADWNKQLPDQSASRGESSNSQHGPQETGSSRHYEEGQTSQPVDARTEESMSSDSKRSQAKEPPVRKEMEIREKAHQQALELAMKSDYVAICDEMFTPRQRHLSNWEIVHKFNQATYALETAVNELKEANRALNKAVKADTVARRDKLVKNEALSRAAEALERAQSSLAMMKDELENITRVSGDGPFIKTLIECKKQLLSKSTKGVENAQNKYHKADKESRKADERVDKTAEDLQKAISRCDEKRAELASKEGHATEWFGELNKREIIKSAGVKNKEGMKKVIDQLVDKEERAKEDLMSAMQKSDNTNDAELKNAEAIFLEARADRIAKEINLRMAPDTLKKHLVSFGQSIDDKMSEPDEGAEVLNGEIAYIDTLDTIKEWIDKGEISLESSSDVPRKNSLEPIRQIPREIKRWTLEQFNQWLQEKSLVVSRSNGDGEGQCSREASSSSDTLSPSTLTTETA